MAEAPSVTTFVMGPRLPWPDDSSGWKENGPFEAGVLHDSGARHNCPIRKISPLGATIGTEVAKAPGAQVAVELATGQRPAGTIAWVKGGETGISFNQPIDVLALINRTLVNQPAERRRMPRVEIRCSAALKYSHHLLPCFIRNISARGVQVEVDTPPPVDTYVSLYLDGLNIPPGEVVWRQSEVAGIELLEELSWSSIMPWIRELVRKQAQ